MKRVVLVLMVACACPSKSTSTPSGGSGGTKVVEAPPAPSGAAITTCDEAKPKIEALYRAEAQVKEPKRVDEAVADNTAMVLADCKKAPAKVVPCLASAETIADIEKKCVIQLDDEGTEGEQPK